MHQIAPARARLLTWAGPLIVTIAGLTACTTDRRPELLAKAAEARERLAKEAAEKQQTDGSMGDEGTAVADATATPDVDVVGHGAAEPVDLPSDPTSSPPEVAEIEGDAPVVERDIDASSPPVDPTNTGPSIELTDKGPSPAVSMPPSPQPVAQLESLESTPIAADVASRSERAPGFEVSEPSSDPDDREVAAESMESELDDLLAELEGESDKAAPASPPSVDHSAFDAILRATVRDERVDYDAIAARHLEALDRYLVHLAGQHYESLSVDEQLAAYINLYNAAMIRAVIDRRRDHRDWTPAADDFAVFDAPLVALGDRTVSLNHLEHELIRKRFDEPRIHVALVCAARSCPPLLPRAYLAGDVRSTLEQNMRSFLGSGFRNRIDRRARTLYLSRLFDWYADDFGGKSRVARYVDRFVEGDVSDYRVEFLEYRWDLNVVGSD